MTPKQNRDPSAKPARLVEPSRDLSHLMALGANVRSRRAFRDFRAFLLPVVMAIALQSVIYLAIYSRGQMRWPIVSIVLCVLALVPLLSALTLSAFRRHEAPIVASFVIVAVYSSFAITLLSAFRLHLSYVGLGLALPITMLTMAFGNIAFQRRLSARAAFLAFEGDGAAAAMLGARGATRITDPEADISKFDTILFEPHQHHTIEWAGLFSRCYVGGIDLMPWTQFLEIQQGRVHIPAFEVSDLLYSPSQLLYARSKRFLDVLAVLLTMPLTLPLAGLTALYIFACDPGPVLFVQHRRGFGGRVFRMYKFRTMYQNTAKGSTQLRDKRIIRGCKLIRKLRLDELPQLYNILRRDMSLIGPRPVAEYVARTSIIFEPKYALRNLVLPGITGWAQVNSGYASNTEQEIEKLSYDLYYVKHLSFDLDLLIIFRSVTTVLLGKGAR